MRLFVAFILVLSSVHLQAQRSFEVNPHAHSIAIGEALAIDLTTIASPNDSIIWPKFGDTMPGGLEVLSYDEVDTSKINDGDLLQYSRQLSVIGFDSGLFAVPPFQAVIGSDTFESEAFLIEVQTVQVDTAQPIRDIVDPSDIPFGWEDLWYYTKKYGPYALGLAAVIGLLLYFILKKRKEEVEEEIEEPKLPAFEIAQSRLDALNEKELWQKGESKEYYLELSNIMRECLENQWSLNALETTSGEILRDLESIASLRPMQDEMRHFLAVSDMAKFAKARPSAEDNLKNFAFVEQLIEKAKKEYLADVELRDKEGGRDE